MKKYVVILLLIVGCASKSNKMVLKISLVDSSKSLKITGVDDDILQEISRDSANNAWLSLVPVYRTPTDTDLKDLQAPQPGKYLVTNGAIVFTPDTPFKSNQAYFVRYYRYNDGNSIVQYLKHEKKLGQTPYTDLNFKR